MITQARLKEVLHYDPDTGVFTWKVNKGNRARAGSEAGCVHRAGRTHYRQIMIDGTKYRAHRLAWMFVHGEFPKHHIDHIDGIGLNNPIRNLRDVTQRENIKNSRMPCTNTSGIVGVSFDRGKWKVQIRTESGNKHIGRFTDIEDAVAARKAADIKYGYHENHGRTRVIGVEQESDDE
jgi:hypothetical protein